MKKIFFSQNSFEVGALKNVLECSGIRCDIRSDAIGQTIPSRSFEAELWVRNDEDNPKARDLGDRWQHPSTQPPPYWMCLTCGAGSEDQFISCWKCGTNRHANS